MCTDKCSYCSKEIAPGEPMRTVNVHEEISDGEEVLVLGATCVLTCCMSCVANMKFAVVAMPDEVPRIES